MGNFRVWFLYHSELQLCAADRIEQLLNEKSNIINCFMNIFRPEVDINIVSSSFTGGYTPLHTAAEINNIQALQFILQVISLLLLL